MEGERPVDVEFEKLKKRRLDVLNESAKDTGPFTLEDDGSEPDGVRERPEILRDRVVQGLRTVFDPEIPLNIYDSWTRFTVSTWTSTEMYTSR